MHYFPSWLFIVFSWDDETSLLIFFILFTSAQLTCFKLAFFAVCPSMAPVVVTSQKLLLCLIAMTKLWGGGGEEGGTENKSWTQEGDYPSELERCSGSWTESSLESGTGNILHHVCFLVFYYYAVGLLTHQPSSPLDQNVSTACLTKR